MKKIEELGYLHAQTEKESAYNFYNYASVKLDLAQIKERLAELRNQCEPANKIIGNTKATRKQLYAAAFYVVVGRLPESFKEQGEQS